MDFQVSEVLNINQQMRLDVCSLTLNEYFQAYSWSFYQEFCEIWSQVSSIRLDSEVFVKGLTSEA